MGCEAMIGHSGTKMTGGRIGCGIITTENYPVGSQWHAILYNVYTFIGWRFDSVGTSLNVVNKRTENGGLLGNRGNSNQWDGPTAAQRSSMRMYKWQMDREIQKV